MKLDQILLAIVVVGVVVAGLITAQQGGGVQQFFQVAGKLFSALGTIIIWGGLLAVLVFFLRLCSF